MSGVFDHLWQSTLFAAVAALLALALRRNAARVRHWIWLAASVKLLIPFSFFVWCGSQVSWRTTPALPAQSAAVIEVAGQPFEVHANAAIPVSTPLAPVLLIAIWACGSAIVLGYWLVRWRRIQVAIREGQSLELDFPAPAKTSATMIEPGIFGVFRPVLLLPEGMADRLTALQMRSILDHELCHVQRRDNLTAAMHMIVEAAFWFHPLVWWLGAKLVEERERACDEAVLESGNEPRVYAEGILQICKFYLESPLMCASGVTGSDLKRRIATIMSGHMGTSLSMARKCLLTAAAIVSVGAPVTVGVLGSFQVLAQIQVPEKGFEVASIKRSDPGQRGNGIPPASGGRFRAINVPVRELLGYAFHTQNRSRMSGGPAWLDSERFDIVAKAESNAPESLIRPMVLKLLQDRFALKLHYEKRQMQAYVLTVSKGGPKFKVANTCLQDEQHKMPCGGFKVQNRRYVTGWQVSSTDLTEVLEALLDLPVVDGTGIHGVFDMTLQWAPDEMMRPEPGNPNAPTPSTEVGASLFTAIQEQLGLKLEKQRPTIEVAVVDSAEKPTEN